MPSKCTRHLFLLNSFVAGAVLTVVMQVRYTRQFIRYGMERAPRESDSGGLRRWECKVIRYLSTTVSGNELAGAQKGGVQCLLESGSEGYFREQFVGWNHQDRKSRNIHTFELEMVGLI